MSKQPTEILPGFSSKLLLQADGFLGRPCHFLGFKIGTLGADGFRLSLHHYGMQAGKAGVDIPTHSLENVAQWIVDALYGFSAVYHDMPHATPIPGCQLFSPPCNSANTMPCNEKAGPLTRLAL